MTWPLRTQCVQADAGNMIERIDEAGVTVVYAYDTANRLTDRRKIAASTNVELYTYDRLGRLASE